jgi:Zn-dependent peptidase ImmA (M78 family)
MIEKWESGEGKPTLRQLENLARKTLTPLGYFFLPKPPEDRLPIPLFRTIDDSTARGPSPNLIETVQIMQRRQTWMRDYLIEQGQPELTFVGSAHPGDAPERVSEGIRRILGISRGWAETYPTWTDALHALFEAVEQAGILMVANGVVGNNTHRKLNPREFRGFVLTDAYAPLVFINGTDGKAAQMFTVAHEIAHVWFARSAAFDLRDLQPAMDKVEQACNTVAAEFLIPESELRRIWPDVRRDPEPFQALARRFKVSELVAARRALDLKLITKAAFLAFYRDYLNDERRKAGRRGTGGDFFATQNYRIGRRFAMTVVSAAKEGRLLYRDAYELTGLYGQTFDKYSEKLSIVADS